MTTNNLKTNYNKASFKQDVCTLEETEGTLNQLLHSLCQIVTLLCLARMALLFIMALMSVTATLVHSASNKTGCDFTQSNLCILVCDITLLNAMRPDAQYNTLWIKQMRRPEMSCLGQVRSALFAEELWILYLRCQALQLGLRCCKLQQHDVS